MNDIVAIKIALNCFETTLNHLDKIDDRNKIVFYSDREFLAEAKDALLNIGKILTEEKLNNKHLVA